MSLISTHYIHPNSYITKLSQQMRVLSILLLILLMPDGVVSVFTSDVFSRNYFWATTRTKVNVQTGCRHCRSFGALFAQVQRVLLLVCLCARVRVVWLRFNCQIILPWLTLRHGATCCDWPACSTSRADEIESDFRRVSLSFFIRERLWVSCTMWFYSLKPENL